MRIGWVKRNLVGKQKLLTFGRHFSVALINSILTLFNFTMKILSNLSMTCHICHVNAQNTAYFLSYLAFCFQVILSHLST